MPSERLNRLLMFRNTYLMLPKGFFRLVISERDFDEVLSAESGVTDEPPQPLLSKVGRRLMPWFWPRIWEAQRWVQASDSTWYKPSTYQIAEPGPLMVRLLETTAPPASVVDLGCNSGSNLNFLYQAGFRRLSGVDAGREALQLFAQTYPDTWACADVKHDLFQHSLSTLADASVDVLHCNGVTIELVHPSFPIVKEICRVARDAVFISLTEEGHSYPRYYIRQFEANGFRLVWCRRPLDVRNESSILHFVRAG